MHVPLIVSLGLVCCGAVAQPIVALPEALAASAVVRQSLYSAPTYQPLTSDRRLHRIGDLITVIVYEDASATSSANTGATRDSSVGVSLTTPHLGTRNAGLGTTSDFTGGGSTQRAGRLLAQLTVTVRDVYANQDLLVGGEQEVELDGEKQLIRLEGRIRPRDISELNTVLSNRMADAKISFAGTGVLGDRQRPGFWHRFLGLFGF